MVRARLGDRDRGRTGGPLDELAAELVALGRRSGLEAVGIAPADPFESTCRDLHARRSTGMSAGMAFTFRNPERSTDPGRIVPGARALVVGALSYRRNGADQAPAPSHPGAGAEVGPYGRVARYSWKDHYAPLRVRLGEIAGRLRADGWRARVVADDNALVDREAAYRAGIGWYGKNSLLLIPRRGSWFVLGSVVTDAPLPAGSETADDGCGTCRRCLDACPTGAIVAPGVVDARRCLAWLLEAPGDFPVEARRALGDRIYGCDECQEVCPPNRTADRRDPPPPPGPGEEPWVDLVEVVEASDAELFDRFARWYVPARDPRYIRRNALVALGNVGRTGDSPVDARVHDVLEKAAGSDDPLVASHARWALDELAMAEGAQR